MTGNGLPTPTEVNLTIINSSDSICTGLTKLIRSFIYAYRYVRYKYSDDGKISPKFCAELKACADLNSANTNP